MESKCLNRLLLRLGVVLGLVGAVILVLMIWGPGLTDVAASEIERQAVFWLWRLYGLLELGV